MIKGMAGKHRPLWQVLLALSAVLSGLALASLCVGAGDIGPSRSLMTLLGQGTDQERFVLFELRETRLWMALAVGAALGVAGALMQAATRNPLAEPGLLGVTAGSSFAVVLAISLGATAASVNLFTAIVGAVCGCLLVLSVGGVRGVASDPIRLVIAGAAFSSLIMALSTLLLLFDQRTADEIRFWMIGALAGRPLELLWTVVPVILLALVMMSTLLRPLSALALGEHIATGLGHHPRLTRWLIFMVIAVLVGAATATAGPIAFVGLVVPFAARALVGAEIRRVVWVALLLGPVVVLFADVLSRLMVRPYELPIGVITAFIGAPVLVAVVRSQRMPSL